MTLFRARFVRRWPFVLGALFLLYAWAIPDPHAFNNAAVDRTSWALGGLVVILSGLHTSRRSRIGAMCAACFLFVVRITVLCFYPSDLTAGRITAGVIVWLMLTMLVVFLTLASEIIDAPARLGLTN